MNSSPARRLSALLLAALLPCAAAAQARSELPLVTVSGQAELRVPPDEVIFNLEVVRLDRDLPAAQAQNDEAVRQILALARRYDVQQQDVKTDYISVEMKYNTDLVGDGDDERAKKLKREFAGYEVSKSVVVRFTDLTRFEKFFAEVLRAGVSRVGGVEFRTTQIRKYKDQARAAAIRAAREKAVALAAEIGQNVGKAHAIHEDNSERSALSNNYTTVLSGSFSADEDSSFAPGLITVRARVAVSFILN